MGWKRIVRGPEALDAGTYETSDGRHLGIQRSDEAEAYDWTLYGADGSEIDGGRLEYDPKHPLTSDEAVREALRMGDVPDSASFRKESDDPGMYE
jgi:hypothetical protein